MVKATDQPDTDAKTAEPDPAEIWKKDFQCQWYKTSDGDVSDQQSPKDGTPVGGTVAENTGGSTGTTTASTTKRGTELSGSRSPDSGSPAPSLEAPTDGGDDPLSSPNLTVWLLVVAARLCLEP